MPRCQRSTVRSVCVPSLSVDHAVVNDVVALGRLNPGSFVARRIAVRSLQTIVIGIGVSLHKAKSKSEATKDRDHGVKNFRKAPDTSSMVIGSFRPGSQSLRV